jgi:tripartite-type tricarboxylate transporter receptor subunit TctC
MRNVRYVVAVLLGLGLTAPEADAQTYPDRVIKLIVPFTPGGPVDAVARVVAQHLQGRIGQNVIIENRPGGGTTIGTKAAINAPTDGYTLLVTGPQLAYLSFLYPNLDIDPVKSLAPVATVVAWSHVMVVAPSVGAKTVAELVAYAKANPGKLVFGFGLATTPHILGETFKRVTATDIVSVSYRGGEQARADLLGGRVHINIAPIPILRPLIDEGKVRPLAFTGPARSPDLPDVPTMAESGLPEVGFNPDVWLGIMAPVGTPAAAIATVNAAVNESLRSPALQATLAKLGYEPRAMTPQEFSAFLAVELRKWPPLLRAAGLKPE